MVRTRISRLGTSMTVAVAILATLLPLGVADDPDACSIQGIVVDDEVNVVEGALVGIWDTTHTTTTGADGLFEFMNLAAGQYTIEAAKVGYVNDIATADCPAGEAIDVVLQLIPVPPPLTPYSTTFVMTGHISCAAGVFSATNDGCAAVGFGPLDANRFELPLDEASVTGAVYELEWAPASATARCLSLTFPAPQAQTGVTYETDDRLVVPAHAVVGSSPLGVTIKSGGMENPLYFGTVGSQLQLTVRPAWTTVDNLAADLESGCSPSLVVQQSFTLYATLFYNGAAVPAGYTHLA